MKRKLIMIRLMFLRDGFKRAQYLRKHKVFYKQGENCYYHPFNIPSEPHLIALHDNVIIAANVKFITHDILNYMLNNSPKFRKAGIQKYYMGKIEVSDNVFIGANSTIMYNVKIGENSIIAAGSVVTKDVPPGSIVGGVPAKLIGKTEDIINKRLEYSSKLPDEFDINLIKKYFWEN